MLDSPRLARLRAHLWQERESLSRLDTWSRRAGRYAFGLARDLFEGELSLRAMSLVYTTLLSVVPFLALGFSVLKALGVHNSLEPVLLEFLRPLGPRAGELTGNIIGFVEKIQVGLLGSVGVMLLFYTAITMIRKVESSFNRIWRVERPRPFAQRVGEYFGVLMVGPVIMFSAIGVTGWVLNSVVIEHIKGVEPLGFLVYALTRLIPYVMIVGMFTFLYVFMPNTKVTWRAAAIGGLAAGVMWQTASFVFASVVANATNYNAIYSGFAIIIFLLIWLYLGWLILLVGCRLAFYVQRPEYLLAEQLEPRQGSRDEEYLALLVMGASGRRFLAGQPGPTQDEIARELRARPEQVARAVTTLISRRFLVEAGAARTQLIPARDLEAVTLGELWKSIRVGDAPQAQSTDTLAREATRLLDAVETCFTQGAGNLTLRGWLTANHKSVESDPRFGLNHPAK